MKVTPKQRRKVSRSGRLTATEARARIHALNRDPEFAQRFLAGDVAAQREMDRLNRIVASAVAKTAAKERRRIQKATQDATKAVGDDPVSRLTWLVNFAQLKPEDLPKSDPHEMENLDDVKEFTQGPFSTRSDKSSVALGHSLTWPWQHQPGGWRKALAVFAVGKLKEFVQGGTSIRPADLGNFEIRLDRIGQRTAAYYEGDGPAAFAMELARVLAAEGQRIHTCASRPCGHLFVQRKRGKFCSARCSHRERQRLWRNKLPPEERYKERFARYVKSAAHEVSPRGPRKPKQEES